MLFFFEQQKILSFSYLISTENCKKKEEKKKKLVEERQTADQYN